MEISGGQLGRLAVVLAVAIWTVSLVTAPMNDVMDSFLHMINLPFHEAGHILFSPFGRFMTILGGSLMQLLVPAVCAAALYFQNGAPTTRERDEIFRQGKAVVLITCSVHATENISACMSGSGDGRSPAAT